MQDPRNTSIQFVKGVGPAKKKLFTRLGVDNVEDLLYFFPRRYEDRRHMTPILELKVGEWQTVSGPISKQGGRRSWYTKKHVQEIVIDDGQGRLVCVWFNQPYLDRYLKIGKNIVVYGKVDVYKNRLQMTSPEYEVINQGDEHLSTGRIVPIYPLTKGMTQRYIRKVSKVCLERYSTQIKEILPYSLRQQYRLDNIAKSLRNLHFPQNEEMKEKAWARISFEEFFLFQISVILRRLSIVGKKGIVHQSSGELQDRFAELFPFVLTKAQTRVMEEIANGMKNESPMLRLLQGDVGSGKTLMAIWGCVVARQNGYQSAIMAPTEILARQHFEVLQKVLGNSPFQDIRVGLLLSSSVKKEKDLLQAQIRDGTVDILVGTHALIQNEVQFKNLSFVVIDEQHKFGVKQRALLSAKGFNPDVLVMTATPIPRTLCLTLYGDLDVSTIDELPSGRGRVQTLHFPHEKASEVYRIVSEKVKEGQQAYIIYPIIEESEALDLKAAESMFRHLKQHEFKEFRVGLVHGQMKKDDAESIMLQFKSHQLDILVATSVLEVGVDVPNANVMVVEHADRFGLAQLHQLRGRIGRGQHDALCLLVSDMVTRGAQARMKAILSSTDGFKIAQEDLMIRGPGEFFGRHQHGLNELKVADPSVQLSLLESARKEALSLIKSDSKLQSKANQLIRETIQKRYPTYLVMVEAA